MKFVCYNFPTSESNYFLLTEGVIKVELTNISDGYLQEIKLYYSTQNTELKFKDTN